MGETGTRFITIVPELGETSCSGVPVAAGRAGSSCASLPAEFDAAAVRASLRA